MSAFLVLAMALVAAQIGDRHSIALEPGWTADGVALADVDADGTSEVLLAVHADERDFERRIETWRAKSSASPANPAATTTPTTLRALERSASLALTRDVVAFAHGDVLAGGGEELVLFNAGGAFALRPGAEMRPVRLLAADFLWQAADPEEAFEWADGVRDLDGDGLADLVLPGPDGFTIAVQRGSEDAEAAFGIVSRVRVPVETLAKLIARPTPETFEVESGGQSKDVPPKSGLTAPTVQG